MSKPRPALPLSSESFLQELSDDESIEIPQFNYNYDSDGEPSPPSTVEPVTRQLSMPTLAPSSGSASSSKAYRGLRDHSSKRAVQSVTETPSPEPLALNSTGYDIARGVDDGGSSRRQWSRTQSAGVVDGEGLPVGLGLRAVTPSHRSSISGEEADEDGADNNGPEVVSASGLQRTASMPAQETPHQRPFFTSSLRSARPLRLLNGGAKRVRVTELPPVEDEESPAVQHPPSPDSPSSRRSSGDKLQASPRTFPPSPPLQFPPRPVLHHRAHSRTLELQAAVTSRGYAAPLHSSSPRKRSPRSESYEPESSASPDLVSTSLFQRQNAERQQPSVLVPGQPPEAGISSMSSRSQPRASFDRESRKAPRDNHHFDDNEGVALQSTPSPGSQSGPPVIVRDYERRGYPSSRQESEGAPSRFRRSPSLPSPMSSSAASAPSPLDKENPPPKGWKLGWSPPPGAVKRAWDEDERQRRLRVEQRDHDAALREIGNGAATTREARTITKPPRRLSNTAPSASTSAGPAPATVRIGRAVPASSSVLSPTTATHSTPSASSTNLQSLHEPDAQIIQPAKKGPTFWVNKVGYTRLDVLGRGGSSKVYRVLSPDSKIYALKKVTLDRADDDTMSSYMNEIALLRRLDGNDRIIKLIDSEASRKKGSLIMVLECGEIDMAKLLDERRGARLQFQWVETYWQQMLEAVQVIHEAAIVHSDLKPANFVLVRGSLKLIDFGIAKAIPNDTTNIQRDAQIGTANYMSPEAIEDTNQYAGGGKRCMKLGRPSDVWSLGCILYQMIYGAPPFHHLSTFQKMRAIPDSNHIIDFPEVSVPSVRGERGLVEVRTADAVAIPGDVLDVLKSCLLRQPKARRTIPEILASPWLMDWRGSSKHVQSSVAPLIPDRGRVLQRDEVVVTAQQLEGILKSSSDFGAEHGKCSDETIKQWRARIFSGLREDTTA